MKHKFLLFLIIFSSATLFANSHAKPSRSISQTLNSTHNPWPIFPQSLHGDHFKPSFRFLLTGITSFFAAAISSAGGIGGGGLFIPILTIIAGLDLKTASSYTAFMVTGGLVANVATKIFATRGGKPVIDFDISLLSVPCMLLGVSLGVICNLVLPEWLITIFFAIFLVFCTFKTFKSGTSLWKKESEAGLRRNGGGGGGGGEPLMLRKEEDYEGKSEIPWLKLGMLILIWFSFFLLYLLRGNGDDDGHAILNIEACGSEYWIISSIQIPVALLFTAWILFFLNNNTTTREENGGEARRGLSRMLFFPVTGILVGVLGGMFGIGGGMIISPLLLQIGTQPQVTAATCSFMVFFSSIMSATQYILLGMDGVGDVLSYAAICLVGSLVGLTLAQGAVNKYGRASVLVFTIGVGMALSTLLMTIYGVVAVWQDYATGNNMGFSKPC